MTNRVNPTLVRHGIRLPVGGRLRLWPEGRVAGWVTPRVERPRDAVGIALLARHGVGTPRWTWLMARLAERSVAWSLWQQTT